jgi:hypothetical protein
MVAGGKTEDGTPSIAQTKVIAKMLHSQKTL